MAVKTINGEPHVQQGNGLYRRLSVSDEEMQANGYKEPPKYFVDDKGKPYEAIEDPSGQLDSMAAHGAVIAECTMGDAKATMVQADHDVAIPGFDDQGRRTWKTADKGDWINATDYGSMDVVKPGPDPGDGSHPGPAGWDVDYTMCSPGDSQLKWMNFKAGEPNPSGLIVTKDASMPVAVLFNENDTTGEVRPLLDQTVEVDSFADISYKAGNNIIAAHADLSDEPIPGAEPLHMDRFSELMSIHDKVLQQEDPQARIPESWREHDDGPSVG